MLFQCTPKTGCIYMAEVLRSDGSVVKRSGMSPNLITTSGLTHLNGTGNASANYLVVGTGTNAPSISDTTLTNPVMATSPSVPTTTYDRTGELHFIQTSRWYTFTQGAVVGNITEVGLKGFNLGDPVISRALFLDDNGNPTAITVLADEILRVTVFVRVYETPVETGILQISNGTSIISEIPYERNCYIPADASAACDLNATRTNSSTIYGSSTAMSSDKRNGGNSAHYANDSSQTKTTWLTDEVGQRFARVTSTLDLARGNGTWHGFKAGITGLLNMGLSSYCFRVAFLGGNTFVKNNTQKLVLTVDIVVGSADHLVE